MITLLKTLLIGALIGIGLSSCTDNSFSGKADKSNSKTDQDHSEEDAVVPPVNINGSYLRCAFEDEASDPQQTTIGCRFQNEQGQKVPVNSFAEDFLFFPINLDRDRVTIKKSILENDARYEVLFFFKTKFPVKARDAALVTEIAVDITPLGDNGAGKKTYRAPMKQLEIAKEQIPESATFDYEEIKQSVDFDSPSDTGIPPQEGIQGNPIPTEG